MNLGTPDELRAAAEKIREQFEGKQAIYIEKGALRVHVNNVRFAPDGLIRADIEEIPTPGLPVWLGLPITGSPSLRWTIGTSSPHFGYESWHSPPYVGWFLYFSPKLIEAVAKAASQPSGNSHPYLRYQEIRKCIDDEDLRRLKALLTGSKNS